MGRMNLNHWFTGDDNLSISLMRFFVRIKILKNSKNVFYQMTVIDSEKKELVFNFYSLEDAVSFTENTINHCHDYKEVVDQYVEMFDQDKFKSPGVKKDSDDSITLFPDDVDEAIIGYFGDGKSYPVSVREELTVKDHQPDIKFYLVEHLDYDGVKRDNETLLTEGDLKTAVNHYISFYGYQLTDFQYIGGVHNVGYYFDTETPHFDGVKLSVHEKSKEYLKEKID